MMAGFWWRRSFTANAGVDAAERGQMGPKSPSKQQQGTDQLGLQTVSDTQKTGSRSRFLILQNVLGIFLSVTVLVTTIQTAHTESSNGQQCATFVHTLIIAVACILFLISFVGLIATIVTPNSLEWLHLGLVFILVVLLLCFAIFSLEMTNQELAHHVTGYGQSYKEYRLKEYPKWMQRKMKNANYWSKVRACLHRVNVCGSGYIPDFSSNIISVPIEQLTPIQRGCCIPPSACKISFTGSMVEEVDNNFEVLKDSDVNNQTYGALSVEETKEISFSETIHAYTHDCISWNSNPHQLCFSCDTCKAGVIQSIMDKWKNIGTLYSILVTIMIFMSTLISCYIFVDKTSYKDEKGYTI